MAKVTMEETKYGPISDKKFTYAKDIIELMGLLGYTINSLKYTISKSRKDGMDCILDKCFAMFKGSKYIQTPIPNKLLKEFQENNVIAGKSMLCEKQEFLGFDLFLSSAMARSLAMEELIYPILKNKKAEYKSSGTAVSAIEELERTLFNVNDGFVSAKESELDNAVQKFMIKVSSSPEDELCFDSNLHCIKESIKECDAEYVEQNNKTLEMFEKSNKENINYYYNHEYSTLTDTGIINIIEEDYKKANLQAAKNIEVKMNIN